MLSDVVPWIQLCCCINVFLELESIKNLFFDPLKLSSASQRNRIPFVGLKQRWKWDFWFSNSNKCSTDDVLFVWFHHFSRIGIKYVLKRYLSITWFWVFGMHFIFIMVYRFTFLSNPKIVSLNWLRSHFQNLTSLFFLSMLNALSPDWTASKMRSFLMSLAPSCPANTALRYWALQRRHKKLGLLLYSARLSVINFKANCCCSWLPSIKSSSLANSSTSSVSSYPRPDEDWMISTSGGVT